MKFDQPLIKGFLIKRYKRFLADIELPSGEIVTAHCPNSGSMKTCDQPGWEVRLSPSDNPKRKLKYTWEMVHNGKCWIGINTIFANKIAAEGIRSGMIRELQGYERLQTERKYGQNSRVDLLLSNGEKKCFVEVKNVTLVEEDGFYRFPDAVTKRGLKHLQELTEMVRQGHRAVMLFLIQRSDGTLFKPADHIDPQYGRELRNAFKVGVEILPYRAEVSPQEIVVKERVPFALD
ncbi:DNA/RNA nuclease SfsA [candidate division KSB1 bacterium]|nr:MAG: DNA/RNA nuclease SfsA [candidate division KSB1 bacterium]